MAVPHCLADMQRVIRASQLRGKLQKMVGASLLSVSTSENSCSNRRNEAAEGKAVWTLSPFSTHGSFVRLNAVQSHPKATLKRPSLEALEVRTPTFGGYRRSVHCA